MPDHTVAERNKKKVGKSRSEREAEIRAGKRGFLSRVFLSNPNRIKGRLREQVIEKQKQKKKK